MHRQGWNLPGHCSNQRHHGFLDSHTANSNGPEIEHAEEQEDRSTDCLCCRFSVSHSSAILWPKLTSTSTLVTSIVRLVLMIPMVKNMDQTWVVSVPCIWM